MDGSFGVLEAKMVGVEEIFARVGEGAMSALVVKEWKCDLGFGSRGRR
jgi:hypothetical protein